MAIPTFDFKTYFKLELDPKVIRVVDDTADYNDPTTNIDSVVEVTAPNPIGLLPPMAIDNNVSTTSSDTDIPLDYDGNPVEGIYAVKVTTTITDQAFSYPVESSLSDPNNIIYVSGDLTAYSPATVTLSGTPASDGTYTVNNIGYQSNNDRTFYEVAEAITDDLSGQGTLTFALTQVYINNYEFYFCFTEPTASIEHSHSCLKSELISKDLTDYGTGIESMVRTHTLKHPQGILDSVTDFVTDQQSLRATPIYTKTWTTVLLTKLTYLINGLYITYNVNASKEYDVDCSVNFCCIYDCVKAFYDRWIAVKAENSAEGDRLGKQWIRMNALLSLGMIADDCGNHEDLRCYFDEIETIIKANGCDCGCGCGDDTGAPTKIDPLTYSEEVPNVIVSALGNGVTVEKSVVGGVTTYTIGLNNETINTLKGPKGADGDDGVDGTIWYYSAGAPTAGVGVDGDFYIRSDSASKTVYRKVSGSWVEQFNMEGADGNDGNDGADGSQWLTGAGVPAGGTGVDGDWYIDSSSSTKDYYYKSGGAWAKQGELNPFSAKQVITVNDPADSLVMITDNTTVTSGGITETDAEGQVTLTRVAPNMSVISVDLIKGTNGGTGDVRFNISIDLDEVLPGFASLLNGWAHQTALLRVGSGTQFADSTLFVYLSGTDLVITSGNVSPFRDITIPSIVSGPNVMYIDSVIVLTHQDIA